MFKYEITTNRLPRDVVGQSITVAAARFTVTGHGNIIADIIIIITIYITIIWIYADADKSIVQ